MSKPRVLQAGVPQGSILSPTLYNMYINDASQSPGVYLSLFVDNTCLHAQEGKDCRVLRKLQRRGVSLEHKNQ
jgi:hypothetical protein